jgi:alpha-L-fucosidase
VHRKATQHKWEATRGLGYSFGYNRNEGPEQMLSTDMLIRLFVDIVSKNGNLLLNVGPMADGTISDLQRERLMGLGQWLTINGEAIFTTQPWITADGRTTDGSDVRFTRKGDSVYVILFDQPQGDRVTVESLQVTQGTTIHLLGHSEALSWKQVGKDLMIVFPNGMRASPAHAFRITLQPRREQ